MTLLTDIFGESNVVRSTIENGDTTHAPSGDTIFHALEGKVSTSLTINGLPLTSNININVDTAISITASEALAAGDIVNIYDYQGTKCRKAFAATSGKEANGFVLISVDTGSLASVYSIGNNTSVSGLSIGAQYLSSTIPGKCTSIPPSGVGIVSQKVGFATSATSLTFQREIPIVLAS
jgi:hypothetical protein